MDAKRLPAKAAQETNKALRRVAGKAKGLVRRERKPQSVARAATAHASRLVALGDSHEVRALAKQVRDAAVSTTTRVVENRQFLVVEIPTEARAAFDGGGLALMTSDGAKKAALVAKQDVDVAGKTYHKGQLVRHANAKSMTKAAKAARVLGPAAYQLASIAVAQDHLAEIRQRLQRIDAKLDHLVQDIHHETASVLKRAEFELGLVSRALDRGAAPDPSHVFSLEAALKAVRERIYRHQPRVLDRRQHLQAVQAVEGRQWVEATARFLKDAERWSLDMVSYDLACRTYNRCVTTLAAVYEERGDDQEDWFEAIEQEAIEVFDALGKARECLQARGIGLEDLERVGYQRWEVIPLHQRRKQRRQAIDAYWHLRSSMPSDVAARRLLIGEDGDVWMESDQR